MKVQEPVADKLAGVVKNFPIFSLFVVAITLAILLAVVPFSGNPVVFNQNYQEQVWEDYGTLDFSDRLKSIVSNYSSRINDLFNDTDEAEVNVASVDSVFSYVWSHLPYFAIVYPTEMYYYYRIPSLHLAGNLRFSDIEEGKLSFAFYGTDNVSVSDRIEGYKQFEEKDGVEIELVKNNRVKISFSGKSVIFELPAIYAEAPKNLKLLPEEEFVAKVRDESGMLFFMLFNNKANSFYYVLDEEVPVPDTLTELFENIFIGERTQFAYFQDQVWNRKILIGVSTDNILQNNYFDGPFDQVPPNLELREQLYKAYPYTQYLNGLDPHGNFLDWNGQRVAVSAYTDYVEESELRDWVGRCDQKNEPSAFWSCLTYESKKDFHKTIPEFFYPDGRKKE